MRRKTTCAVAVCLLLVWLASAIVPGTSARYILTLTNQFVGEINFTGVERTNTFVIVDEENLSSSGHLFGHDSYTEDNKLVKPSDSVLNEFGIDSAQNITYPVANATSNPARVAFLVSYCAMQSANSNLNFTVTMEIQRAGGEVVQLSISGQFVTGTTQGTGTLNVETDGVVQYSDSGLGILWGQNYDYVLYRGMVDPQNSRIAGNLKKTVSGQTTVATADDFILGPGDYAECTLTLEFAGTNSDFLWVNFNKLACYASIQLQATPIS